MMRGDCSERLGFTAFTGWQSGFTAISWIPPVNSFNHENSGFKVKVKGAELEV